MKISGMSAIVTGGASGLGEATCRELASAGVQVAIFDANENKGALVAKDIGGAFFKVDVSSETSVKAAVEGSLEAVGASRILINCAGIGAAVKTVSGQKPHPLDAFEQVIRVNLTGCFNCIRLAAAEMSKLAPMEAGERGVIVNTASGAAFEGQIGQAAYSASKGGMVAMTLPIARDLSGLGIRVNTIAPGMFNTPLLENVPESVRDTLASMAPFPRRLGEPAEFAHMVRAICENSMINGETVRLDAALRMQPK